MKNKSTYKNYISREYIKGITVALYTTCDPKIVVLIAENLFGAIAIAKTGLPAIRTLTCEEYNDILLENIMDAQKLLSKALEIVGL
jgi:hypothetical protein